MAIFRARGGRSLTTWPPMRISPLVGGSSPAIMRSSVVLPQPDGPRRTRNSPSRVTRSTPSTARTSPNTLRTARVSTVAMAQVDAMGAAGARRAVRSRNPRRAPFLSTSRRCAGRLGEHDVQHPRVEDLVDGRIGVAGIADVGGPVQHVLQYRVLVLRRGLA